ncbi:hypothetical protein D9615_010210 [Tricholomella constricta]|uniref:Uncharacterized protein n=1 Tax=Tricholomella constricta TaxID=117010 RepID=A0A8H5LSS3_9AGAR|nr:hypothetical protein D9615_010210 [Tricholomella constricta]
MTRTRRSILNVHRQSLLTFLNPGTDSGRSTHLRGPQKSRAFCALAGTVLVGEGVDFGVSPALEFAKALVPALEGGLKMFAGNLLNASAGPLEAYVATVVLLGPLARTGMFGMWRRHLEECNSEFNRASSTKSLFLLCEKVYQKITDATDEKWLLSAWEIAFVHFKADFAKSEQLRLCGKSQLGLVLLHLALDGSTPQIRREVNAVVTRCTANLPELTNRIVRDGLNTLLARGPPASARSGEESIMPWNKHSRLSALLLSAVKFPEEVELPVREDLIVKLIILGHHHLICGNSRQTWIDLCQKARTDPHDLTTKHLDKLFKLILGASAVDAKTLATAPSALWLAPEVFFPRIMEQLQVDMNPSLINSLTETDFGIWLTPNGMTYIDGTHTHSTSLSLIPPRGLTISHGTIANKRAASSKTLMKQQLALVTTQLEEEAKVRQHVASVQVNLHRGLMFVRSLVAAGTEQFPAQISKVAVLLLEGALEGGSPLVGREAFDTYLELAKCSSGCLDTLRSWVGVAALRSLEIEAVPEELQSEPLNLLILRVLYRLRTLSEQAPFDAATFSYAYPLLGWVLLKGGISVEEEKEALEQVALSLAIINFHSGDAIEKLLHVIRQQPKLSKDVSSTLVDLGEAIQASASQEELSVLFRGTLMQEVYVRNSCLQTLRPFKLTDLDWSPELLIACHGKDEQNARLARHLWEDNGLDDQALGDRTPDVRRGMLNAGTSIIDLHGAERLAALISIFENHLAQPSPATETDDHIKEAVIIFFGRVARHLDLSDPVYQASLTAFLMDDLLNSPKYATRRGAAYGLAGVLKGTGISGIKEFDIITRLRGVTEDKKRYEPRQGVMFAFETLSNTFGRLFEPYITYVLPLLLTLFGDTTSDVREATQDAARVIMGNMFSYGVKLILPSLLGGLDEKQWRTKKGSIELLGMMAYGSPRQLSLSALERDTTTIHL